MIPDPWVKGMEKRDLGIKEISLGINRYKWHVFILSYKTLLCKCVQ